MQFDIGRCMKCCWIKNNSITARKNAAWPGKIEKQKLQAQRLRWGLYCIKIIFSVKIQAYNATIYHNNSSSSSSDNLFICIPCLPSKHGLIKVQYSLLLPRSARLNIFQWNKCRYIRNMICGKRISDSDSHYKKVRKKYSVWQENG